MTRVTAFIVVFALALASFWQISPAEEDDQAAPPPDSAAVDTTDAPTIQIDMADVAVDTIKAVDQHPQDAPENRGFLIVTDDRRAQMRIRGSIRVTGFYDVDGLSNVNFVTFDIPVGDNRQVEPRFFMTARQTRMGFEMTRDTGLGEAFLRIEADFASPAEQFRLRHGYGQLAHVLIGQTWTTFGDVSALPLTVDFEGPNSAVTIRNTQIRFFNDRDDKVHYAVAIENPVAEVAVADTLIDVIFQTTPDFTARYRRAGAYGQWQVAAVARLLSYRDSNEDLRWVPGYGLSLTGKVELWGRNSLLYQGIAGTAISRYVKALSGRGLDLVLNPNTIELEPVESWGYYLALQLHWSDKWQSNIIVGGAGVQNKDFQPPTAYRNGQYVALNLFQRVSAGILVGLEYNWGRRENANGQAGTASRVQYAVYYDF